MNESRLDEDLKALAERPGPKLPSDFNSMVWAKVQKREAVSHSGQGNWLNRFITAFATPRWAAVGLALAILAGWALGRIAPNPGTSSTETRLAGSVTGEVIDLACYFDNGACGPKHAACAEMCIASGLPVGLKAEDGTIYVLIGKQIPPSAQLTARHQTLNAELAPLAAKIVTVSGTIVSRKGVSVIENAEVRDEQAESHVDADLMTDSKTQFTHFL